jgi:hypothetical protein
MAAEHYHTHSTGIGLGGVVAAMLSWAQWHSVGWAIAHGACGWFYIIFWALGMTDSAPF